MRWIFVLLLMWPGFAAANDWDALRQPGAIAIMRHALAPGTGDPARFALEDCSTQRNLDQRGREQAVAIGDALRAEGMMFDTVLTSQWCRTRETAALLGYGPPQDAPSLNSFFGRTERRAAQTRDTIAMLQTLQGRGMLVTHQVNITALTGRGTQSGEIVVFRLTDTGVELLGSILIAP
jgi:phosphohistidine phosphatase SixA